MESTDTVPYSLAPRVLLTGERTPELEGELAAAGYQLSWHCAPEELERQQRAFGPDAIVVALEANADDALLDAVDALAAAGDSVIVRFPGAALPAVADRLGGGEAILLGDPAPGELAGLLTLLRSEPGSRLHDSAGSEDAVRLQLLADQVSRIARTLADMTENAPVSGRRGGLRSPTDDFQAPRPITTDAPVTARAVRAVIAERRLRERFLDPDLFGEPAWDMLLDLYAARLEHARVSVSSLCIAAAVPSTTALRWLRTLTQTGLVHRRADPHDKRRVFIELADGAAAGMNGYFAALSAH